MLMLKDKSSSCNLHAFHAKWIEKHRQLVNILCARTLSLHSSHTSQICVSPFYRDGRTIHQCSLCYNPLSDCQKRLVAKTMELWYFGNVIFILISRIETVCIHNPGQIESFGGELFLQGLLGTQRILFSK